MAAGALILIVGVVVLLREGSSQDTCDESDSLIRPCLGPAPCSGGGGLLVLEEDPVADCECCQDHDEEHNSP